MRDKIYNKKQLINAWQCFFLHMCIEIICFGIMKHVFNIPGVVAFFAAIIYDMIAFYPQFLVGMIHEKYPKINISGMATAIMGLGICVVDLDNASIRSIIGVVLIATGNAILHDCCAIETVKLSEGKLFPSALYVGGGSVGVFLGTYVAQLPSFSKILLFITLIIMAILVLLTNNVLFDGNHEYPKFDITVKSMSGEVIVILAFIVTLTRSYMGFVIPMSWKQQLWQTGVLYVMMGTGKSIGGYFADRIGIRKTGVFSSLLCIPLLIFGKNIMFVSIAGIFLFSMTMSITFAMVLSVYGKNPGFAFGITTIALVCGVLASIFLNFSMTVNIIIIVVFSIVSAVIMAKTIKKGM